MVEVRVPSPAKINLFLHIIGQRSDGYHRLQTAFQFLDFCDDLTFRLTSDSKITLDVTGLAVPVEENLIHAATRLLQDKGGVKQGVEIFLDKKIPLGGGLGGGSSNAGTTLLVLNQLWNLGLSTSELMTLGLSLGADVPIFIHGKAAFAQGIGEKLQTIDPAEDWFVLLFPGCHVNTGKIFSDSQLTRNTPPITIAEFFEEGGHNDCEPIARNHFPKIADALDWLGHYASARMTGTGSCVFATFKDKEAALKIIKNIPASFNGIVVKGLNTSPLHNIISSF